MKTSYVTKLRIVQLHEVDFNTILKYLLRRRLMGHSEEHGLNGHHLYGSTKVKSTYDDLITVRIIYNMARSQRNYAVSMFNNLKGRMTGSDLH